MPSREGSMEDVLIDAQVLAEFSNLNPADNDPLSPTNASHFRHNHPRFVPDYWWANHREGKSSEPRHFWNTAQLTVQDAWKEKFSLEKCVWLISYGHSVVPARPLPDFQSVWSYQQAVMFLGTNRWRAKFCLRCGSRFVATTPKSLYCSDACFQSSRKDSKKAWWTQHGPQWRNERTKSTKSKRSR